MSDTSRGDRPDEAEAAVQQPLLFASGHAHQPATGEHPAVGEHPVVGEHPATGEHPVVGEHPATDPDEVEPEASPAGAIQLAEAEEDDPATRRRKRRITVTAIAIGAAVIVIALCAGGLGIVSAVHSARSNAADARAARSLREADCLELETRLNHLVPPGATTTPAARAAAVQDENEAVRIYLSRLRDQSTADDWRQLLDARTIYAQSLQQGSKTKTTAFFVAPRTGAGAIISDQLLRMSPAQCGGPVRRLAQPDL